MVMKKLVLVEFIAKSNESEWYGYRLVVVNTDENVQSMTEQSLMMEANRIFTANFVREYPESKLLASVALPTWGAL